MRFVNVLRYFLNEAGINLWANRLNNMVSIAIISFSLFTLGLFLLSAENLANLIGQWAENVQVNVFLQKSTSQADAAKLESIIKASPFVSRYQYISSEEALKRFHSFYPEMHEITRELDNNPFPPSYEVTIRKEFQNQDAVRQFVSQLRDEDSVQDVEYDQEWIDRVQFAIRFLKTVGLSFGGILMLTATFSISNVIKLMVMSRRDEIEIMRLVGATNSFIKGPFVTEGILHGLLGGVLAILFLFGVYSFLTARISALNAPFFSISQLQFLSPAIIIAIAGGGMIVGLFGSLFSLSKLLKI
ncbi:MAG TPA: permease-like cell division protein FtsX [Acidobacteriota bacterium]|nr:permease-like cell division protein FtsX [Acidobacteriota bacterium]